MQKIGKTLFRRFNSSTYQFCTLDNVPIDPATKPAKHIESINKPAINVQKIFEENDLDEETTTTTKKPLPNWKDEENESFASLLRYSSLMHVSYFFVLLIK